MVAKTEKPPKPKAPPSPPEGPVMVTQQVFIKPETEKTLFTWTAKERPFKRRNKEFWVSVTAMSAIAGFILYLIEGVISVALVIAGVFLFYIISTVEPHTTEYKITNRGIIIGGRFNELSLFTRYWFARRFDSDLMILEMVKFPGRLEMVINGKDKEAIRKALLNYLPEEKAPPTNLDNTADWIASKIPGNK